MSMSVGSTLDSAYLDASLIKGTTQRTSDTSRAHDDVVKRSGDSEPHIDETTRKEGQRGDLTPQTQQATGSEALVGVPTYNYFGRVKSPRASAGSALNVAA